MFYFLLALVGKHDTWCISRGQISDCSWPFVCRTKQFHLLQGQQSLHSSEYISVQGAEKYVLQSGGCYSLLWRVSIPHSACWAKATHKLDQFSLGMSHYVWTKKVYRAHHDRLMVSRVFMLVIIRLSDPLKQFFDEDTTEEGQSRWCHGWRLGRSKFFCCFYTYELYANPSAQQLPDWSHWFKEKQCFTIICMVFLVFIVVKITSYLGQQLLSEKIPGCSNILKISPMRQQTQVVRQSYRLWTSRCCHDTMIH